MLPYLLKKLRAVTLLDGRKADLKMLAAEFDAMEPDLREALEWALETQDLRALNALSDQVGPLRRMLLKMKAPAVVSYAAGILEIEPETPLIIWAHHREGIALIAEGLKAKGLRVAVITGDTNLKDRDRIVASFQAGDLDVLVANMRAAGVGLTLTRSNHALFAELLTGRLLGCGASRGSHPPDFSGRRVGADRVPVPCQHRR